MTKPVSFNVRLENDPTKQQEIEVLHKMYNAFKGSGTYLETMLSEKLIEFAQNQIMNDFPPDIMEHLDGADVSTNLAKEDVRLLKLRVEVLENDIKVLEDDLQTESIRHEKTKKRNSAKHDEWLTERKDWRVTTGEYLRENADLVDRANEAERKAADLEQELLVLKATAFDKITSGVK